MQPLNMNNYVGLLRPGDTPPKEEGGSPYIDLVHSKINVTPNVYIIVPGPAPFYTPIVFMPIDIINVKIVLLPPLISIYTIEYTVDLGIEYIDHDGHLIPLGGTPEFPTTIVIVHTPIHGNLGSCDTITNPFTINQPVVPAGGIAKKLPQRPAGAEAFNYFYTITITITDNQGNKTYIKLTRAGDVMAL